MYYKVIETVADCSTDPACNQTEYPMVSISEWLDPAMVKFCQGGIQWQHEQHFTYQLSLCINNMIDSGYSTDYYPLMSMFMNMWSQDGQ